MRRAPRSRLSVTIALAIDRSDTPEIGVPTLILGNRLDPIHPWPLANTLAGLIPGAVLREITPKSVSPEAHSTDVSRSKSTNS